MKKLSSLILVALLAAPSFASAATADSQALTPVSSAKASASKARHHAKKHAAKVGRHHRATNSGKATQVAPGHRN